MVARIMLIRNEKGGFYLLISHRIGRFRILYVEIGIFCNISAFFASTLKYAESILGMVIKIKWYIKSRRLLNEER